MSTEPDRTEEDCPAVFADIGLECALMTGHDNGWHWDPRGVDWREEPGIEPLFGQPDEAAAFAHAAELASRLPPGAAELIKGMPVDVALHRLGRLGDLPVPVTAEPPPFDADGSLMRIVPALPRGAAHPVIEAYGALVQERARLEYSETFGLLSPAAKERLAELRDAMTTSGEIAERARLEWLMAYGVLSPEDRARWEELRRPEVAAAPGN